MLDAYAAARSECFVSTYRSNVGTVVGCLHPDPSACVVLDSRRLRDRAKAAPARSQRGGSLARTWRSTATTSSGSTARSRPSKPKTFGVTVQ